MELTFTKEQTDFIVRECRKSFNEGVGFSEDEMFELRKRNADMKVLLKLIFAFVDKSAFPPKMWEEIQRLAK